MNLKTIQDAAVIHWRNDCCFTGSPLNMSEGFCGCGSPIRHLRLIGKCELIWMEGMDDVCRQTGTSDLDLG